MNYFVSYLRGAVKKYYLITNDCFSFLSHRVEFHHNATLGTDASHEISAVLTTPEKQNMVFFSAKPNCRHS